MVVFQITAKIKISYLVKSVKIVKKDFEPSKTDTRVRLPDGHLVRILHGAVKTLETMAIIKTHPTLI